MTQLDYETAAFIAYFSTIQHQYSFYSFLIVANIGFLVNFLNIITFILRGEKFSKNSMRFYNLLISTSNILALVASYVYLFPNTMGMQNFELISNISCILLSYALRVFLQLSSWLNVMTTLDRLICLTYPGRCKWIKDTRKLTVAALGLFLGLVLINLPNAWFKLETQTTNAANETSLLCTANANIVGLRDLIGVSMRFAVPLVFEVLLNVVLIYKLAEQKHKLRIRSRDMTREYRFAFSILILNVLYIVTETPNFVMTIYVSASGYNQASEPTTRVQALASLIYYFTLVLILFRCDCLFLVNLLVNKVFRREFVSMLMHSRPKATTLTLNTL